MTFSWAKVRIFNDNDDDDDDFFLRKLENTMIFRQKNVRNRSFYCPRMYTNETLMLFSPTENTKDTKRIKERNVSHEGMTYVVTVKAVT